MGNLKKIVTFILLSGLMVLFQNCSPKNFEQPKDQSSVTKSGDTDLTTPKLISNKKNLTYWHDYVQLLIENYDEKATYTWYLNGTPMLDIKDLPVAPGSTNGFSVESLKIHEGQYHVVAEKNGVKKPSNKIDITVSYPTNCFTAHLGNLRRKIPSEDKTYMIDFDGSGPQQPSEIYCLNSVEGGGWMRVSYRDAMDKYYGRMVVVEDGVLQQLTENRGPRTRDDEGNSHHYFEFMLPHSISYFMLADYQIRANAAANNTSDIKPEQFVQTNWTDAYGINAGDIAFGNPNLTSVSYSLAQDNISIECQNCITTVNTGPISMGSSKEFRISFSEAGPELEGWRPWFDGHIYVK